MNDPNHPSVLYADDPTIRQGEDGNWYHFPHRFGLKVGFLLFSLFILAVGIWFIKDPAARFFFGERAQARVTEIHRTEADGQQEVIRYRKTIPEGSHLTRFTYTVIVEYQDGSNKKMDLAIGSLRNPTENVNDEFEVIFFPEEDYAYGLFHHRTWAFGVGFLFVGSLLTLCAVPTLLAVGKPILIDPEAEVTDSEA
jgi:hypothetical protein